jgi:hypothetical protein
VSGRRYRLLTAAIPPVRTADGPRPMPGRRIWRGDSLRRRACLRRTPTASISAGYKPSPTLGIVVVAVVLGTRGYFGEINAWAWRVPFPVSFLPCNLRAGSTTTLKMIGILVVAALSAVVAGVARQAITSGAKAANSAAAGLRAEASAPRSRCPNPRQRIDRCPQQADGISHGSPWLCGW